MRALSIRQPYAELILRGIKKVEYRSRRTAIIGQRFYIYASKKWAGVDGHATVAAPPHGFAPGELPTGVIVGTATITRCQPEPDFGGFMWHLADVRRLDQPIKPERQPQPVWFKPF